MKISITILILFCLIMFGISLYSKIATTYAFCGGECHKIQADTYYAEYARGSREYWNAYCNQMLHTIFECK